MQRIGRRLATSTMAALAALVLVGGGAHAEAFFDLRTGASFTDEGDVEISTFVGSVDFSSEFEDSVTVGGRAGYWFESLPWLGLAVDASYFAPDTEDAGFELDVIPVSPLLMLRAPLASDEEYPHGRFQPFVGIGPGIFITLVDADGGYSDEPADVGLDLHAGLRFLLSRSVGLFVQYRFTSYQVEASDDILGVSVDTDIDLDTHHVAGGVGFSF
jgi:opacity protein-like surface antigen